MKIERILIEDQMAPIGLDQTIPVFSWILTADEGEQNLLQSACRIVVQDQKNTVWDSKKMETDVSTGIAYQGEELKPCTKYLVKAEVWNNQGGKAEAETTFETGFLASSIEAWEKAQWIGAPHATVCAENRGVFTIESEFRIAGGKGEAGLVFGANDFRLSDHTKNEFGIEGENYIRYTICLKDGQARLKIYRVGYAPGDDAAKPFADVELIGFGEEKKKMVTPENADDFHKLTVKVEGNTAFAYVDDILVDAVEEHGFFGTRTAGRQLNPRGKNDVLPYPRLNEIGFYAGDGTKGYFRGLCVRNVRQPSAEIICETPEGRLDGGKSIFAEKLPVENGCFCAENCQVTADPSHHSIPMLRTVFSVNREKTLAAARLYITARGIYDCRINGREITENLLRPGLTQYDHRMNYQTYDITDLVQSGENGIGVTLASGWWSEAQTFVVKNFNYFGDKESLLAKLVLTYTDGSREIVGTNTEKWKYFGEGPYLFSSYFAGEQFDARRAEIYETYSLPEFDDSAWEKPMVIETVKIDEFHAMPGFGRSWPAVNEQQPEFFGEYDAPVRIVDRRMAKTRKELFPGVYLYDLEQEMAGVPRITLHEKAGTRVIIRYAEVLYPDLPEYAGKEGTMMLENYRDATSTDVYICRGGEEVFQPRFTFHGYRYIEISGVEHAPETEEVVSLQYSSVTEFNGSLISSHKLLNRFAENVFWSQKCNFINIPTDCPQRNERMGWAGDTHIFCHTALNNSSLKRFYERNLQAMRDLQTPEGQYPEIAPVGGGFGGITYECASIFMAWELYEQYGDIRTLRKFYPGMQKYMVYMKEKGLPGTKADPAIGPLGDWLAPEETDLLLLWNAFYYKEADLMSRIAGALEKMEEQRQYAALAAEVKTFWNETFVLSESGKTCNVDGTLCDTQCSYAIALAYGVAEDRKQAGVHLIRKTRELGHTVGTGFFGTGILNQMLTEQGAVEDAWKMMLQTAFPSWLYPVTQGATTIWEHWDSYTKEKGFGGQNAMNSFNHYSLGSVLSWLYHTGLGIQRDETKPGYRHILLKPQPGPLEFMKGSVDSPYGVISAGWEKEGETIRYQVTIPVNTTATLFKNPEDLTDTVELGSGTHTLIL